MGWRIKPGKNIGAFHERLGLTLVHRLGRELRLDVGVGEAPHLRFLSRG